jgi:hypothetical protein
MNRVLCSGCPYHHQVTDTWIRIHVSMIQLQEAVWQRILYAKLVEMVDGSLQVKLIVQRSRIGCGETPVSGEGRGGIAFR